MRLCNNVGDVIWSTTQESAGAKFRGASADVATKIARQLAIDFDYCEAAGCWPPAAPSVSKVARPELLEAKPIPAITNRGIT